MALRERMLGQVQVALTGTPQTLYAKPAGFIAIVKTILVCNTDVGAQTFRIYYDDTGAVTTTPKALFYDEPLAAKTSRLLNLFIGMSVDGGTLRVDASVNAAVTFTAFGAEIS
jgi:hypothetical protein